MKKTLFVALLVGAISINVQAEIAFPYIIDGRGSLGMCVYGEADFNQDGYRDLAVTNLAGTVLIYSGKDFSKLDSFQFDITDGDNFALTSIDSDLDGYPDLVVPARDAIVGHFIEVLSGKDGSILFKSKVASSIASLSKISDLNGDGVEEILVGGFSNSYVYSGRDGSILHVLGFTCNHGVMLPIDDINGDGVMDIAASNNSYYETGWVVKGKIAIFSGATGQILKTIIGNGNGFGHCMTTCPDIDGRGSVDLVVSVTGHDSAYIYSSESGLPLLGIAEPFGVPGIFGVYAGNVGDVNGDGSEDFVITDVYSSNEEDFYWSGAVFIFSGATSQLLYSYYGVPYSDFGLSVTSLGDLNGDGRPEIAVGAPLDSKVYIFSTYLPGDANQDGRITLADVMIKVNFLFRSGLRPLPMSIADDNCNGTIDLNDIICTVNYIFRGQTQGCCQK